MIPLVLVLSFTLPIGVQLDDGSIATTGEMAPLSMRDSLAAEAEAAQPAPAGISPEEWRGACRVARQIRTLGTQPYSARTGAWLLSLHEDDGQFLLDLHREISAREARFRGERGARATGDAGGREGDRMGSD